MTVRDSPRNRRAVSLADVAEAAGTSTAVVSYVINDGPRPVAPATRERVLEVIDRLGYRPNRIARALRSNQSDTLGLLIPDITNAFFSDLAHAFETAAFERGYVSFLGNAAFDRRRETSYLRAFVDLQVDGIVVVDLDTGKSDAELFAEIEVPTVFIHHKEDGLPGDFVRFDEEAAGRKVAEAMTEQLVDDIVVVTGPPGPGPVNVRTAAFEQELALRDATATPHRIVADFDRVDAAEVFASFLDAHPDLTNLGVFVPTDEQALGVLHACALHRRSIPDDVVVIGGEGTTSARSSAPGLTSIDVPVDEMASVALDLLKMRMAGDGADETVATLEVGYTERGTSRRPPIAGRGDRRTETT